MKELPRKRRKARPEPARPQNAEQTAARTVKSLSRISAILAAITAGSVVFSIIFVGNAQGKLSLANSETLPVLVATQPIESGAVIEEGMFEVKDMPAYAVVEGALGDPSQAIGRSAIGPIPKNAQLGESELSPSRAALSLADALEPGKFAVSLAVDDETGLSGLLRQGDAVDVLAQGGIVVERVMVLAVDDSLNQARTEYSTVTVQCDAGQAEILHDAQSNAPVRLALRSSAENAHYAQTGED